MLCPKCRQPLEDSAESYICCADATLQWRCLQCAKVSEGFALPYGLCPHCGGKLEPMTPHKIEDAAALDAVRKAFEIELGGQAFYRRAAVDSTDPILQDLFSLFASMEQEHMQTLRRRYHTQIPVASAEFRLETAAIFAGVAVRPADPANLFRIAIQMEQRAARFFEQCAQATSAASPQHQLYRELAAEENEHAALLATEYTRWKQGQPGLLDDTDPRLPFDHEAN
jgi:rubrerythrin